MSAGLEKSRLYVSSSVFALNQDDSSASCSRLVIGSSANLEGIFRLVLLRTHLLRTEYGVLDGEIG